MTFEKTTVVGAGLMGAQIGLVLAMGSKETVLWGRRDESFEKARENLKRYSGDLERHDQLMGQSADEVLGRIRMEKDLEAAVANTEFVAESIVEDLEIKQGFYKEVDGLVPADVPIASNTSGLPITQLARDAKGKDRITGSHFVQPGHIVPVVEVIKGEETSDATIERTCEVWRALGRRPLVVEKDVPGFLVNRLQHAMIREAVNLLDSGVASAQDIDLAVQLGLAPRFTTAGPLEQRDINGMRMHVRVASHLWKTLDGWEDAVENVKRRVERGDVGLDAGRGYYDWTGREAMEVRAVKDEQLITRTAEVVKSIDIPPAGEAR